MRILNGNTKKSTNKYMQSPYPCIYCDNDRCGKSIDMDEDITPYDVFGDHGEFSDNAYRVHEDCLTSKEKKLWEQFEQ